MSGTVPAIGLVGQAGQYPYRKVPKLVSLARCADIPMRAQVRRELREHLVAGDQSLWCRTRPRRCETPSHYNIPIHAPNLIPI